MSIYNLRPYIGGLPQLGGYILPPYINRDGGGGGYVDPVPDWLFRYRLDGNDSALTPVNSPSIVAGLDLPDLKSANLNGVDQRYASSDLPLTAIGGGAFTISMRFNSDNVLSNRAMFATGLGSNADSFRIRNTSSSRFQFRTGGTVIAGTVPLVTNTWYHAVVTSTGSGGTLQIIFDDVIDVTTTSPTYNWNGTGFLQIGAVNGTQHYAGEIDEVRMWDKVLTPTEIAALYNNVE